MIAPLLLLAVPVLPVEDDEDPLRLDPLLEVEVPVAPELVPELVAVSLVALLEWLPLAAIPLLPVLVALPCEAIPLDAPPEDPETLDRDEARVAPVLELAVDPWVPEELASAQAPATQ